jgi:aminoglycoside 6'-N-acetyltransferase
MVLRGERVLLRTALAADVEDLERIRGEPAVFDRWGAFDVQEIADESVGSADHLIVELDGKVIGGIEYYEENEPMYRHASIDIFLTTSHQGQGLGSEAVRVLARYLFEERGHHRLTIDPSSDNEPAIRAYEKVGFRRVGIMRQYERGTDGTWHDGLLMDLLRNDFERGKERRD